MSRRLSSMIVLSSVVVLSLNAAGPTFRPDVVFKGSALTGWTPLGEADWRAQNGEIVGTPKQPGGGWLVLDKSFQDVAVFSNVTCTAGCKAGVLLRAEKTPDGGMKGIYVSLTEGDLAVLCGDARRAGRRELARTQLRPAGRGGGGGGGAAAARRSRRGRSGAAGRARTRRPVQRRRPRAATRRWRGAGAGRGPAAAPPPTAARRDLPGLARPTGELLPGQDEQRRHHAGEDDGHRPVQRRLARRRRRARRRCRTASTARSRCTSAAPARPGSRTSRTRISNARPFEAEKTSPNFRTQRLNEFYYSATPRRSPTSTATAIMDVIAGPYYYLGPTFTVGREFYAGITLQPDERMAAGVDGEPRLRLHRRRLARRPQHERQRRQRHRHALT